MAGGALNTSATHIDPPICYPLLPAACAATCARRHPDSLPEDRSDRGSDGRHAGAITPTVQRILENIAKNSERAVREYSQKFDKWSPERFRLSKAQIRECVDQVPDSVKRDIEFAQTQIRNFALA
jgi:histidinol dehydrogenase